ATTRPLSLGDRQQRRRGARPRRRRGRDAPAERDRAAHHPPAHHRAAAARPRARDRAGERAARHPGRRPRGVHLRAGRPHVRRADGPLQQPLAHHLHAREGGRAGRDGSERRAGRRRGSRGRALRSPAGRG
ncbi:MAG: hypothetical protein AVDCRST_MAG40-3370, partial [uncultured Gemmatimonadaceae bacterium]